MPTHTIQFQIPEEQEELEDAEHGTDWKLVVFNMREWFFRELKMADSDDCADMLDKGLGYLNDTMEEKHVFLD